MLDYEVIPPLLAGDMQPKVEWRLINITSDEELKCNVNIFGDPNFNNIKGTFETKQLAWSGSYRIEAMVKVLGDDTGNKQEATVKVRNGSVTPKITVKPQSATFEQGTYGSQDFSVDVYGLVGYTPEWVVERVDGTPFQGVRINPDSGKLEVTWEAERGSYSVKVKNLPRFNKNEGITVELKSATITIN